MDQTAKIPPHRTMDFGSTKPSISRIATKLAASSDDSNRSALSNSEVDSLVKDWKQSDDKTHQMEIDRLEKNRKEPTSPAKRVATTRTTFIDGTSPSSARAVINSASSETKKPQKIQHLDSSDSLPKTVQKKPARSIYALASKEPDDIEVIDEETLMAEMESRGDATIQSSVSKVVEEPTRSIYALAPKTTHLGKKTVRRLPDDGGENENLEKPKKRAGLFSAFRNKSVRYIPPKEDVVADEVEEVSSEELLQTIDQGAQPAEDAEKVIANELPEADEELVGYVPSARDLINASAENLRKIEADNDADADIEQASADEDALAKAFEEDLTHSAPSEMPTAESTEVVVPLVREEIHPAPKRPDQLTNNANRKIQLAKAHALKQRAATQVERTKNPAPTRKMPVQTVPVVKTSLRLKPVSPRNVNIVEKKNDIARIIQMEQHVEEAGPQTTRPQTLNRRHIRPARNLDIIQPARKRPRRAKVPIEVQVMPRSETTPKVLAPIKHTKGPVTIAISVPGEEEKIHHVAVTPKTPERPQSDFSVPVVKRAVPPSVEQFMIDQPAPNSIRVNHTKEALAHKSVDDLELGIIEDYYSGEETDAIAANRTIKLSKNPQDPVRMVSNLTGNPEQKRFPLGAKSPFLKTVNVEKRPLSEPMEHLFDEAPIVEDQPKPVAKSQPEKKPFNARDYFLKPEDQKPAPSVKTKDNKKADRKAAKTQKEEQKSTKISRKEAQKVEKPVKKSRKERKQEKAMMAPTVIVPSHSRSNAPLILLAVVTIILGAAVGAAVYMCLVLGVE